jgi:RNA polymerase sigma-70 factor (ECF subfamily)
MRTISRDSLELQHQGALSYLRQAILAGIGREIRPPSPKSTPAFNAALSADAAAVGREEIERYDRALHRLVPLEREAIIARVELGYSYDDVAKAVGCKTPDDARRVVIVALLHLAEEMHRGA